MCILACLLKQATVFIVLLQKKTRQHKQNDQNKVRRNISKFSHLLGRFKWLEKCTIFFTCSCYFYSWSSMGPVFLFDPAADMPFHGNLRFILRDQHHWELTQVCWRTEWYTNLCWGMFDKQWARRCNVLASYNVVQPIVIFVKSLVLLK